MHRPGPAVVQEDVCVQDALSSQRQLHVPPGAARQRPPASGGAGCPAAGAFG